MIYKFSHPMREDLAFHGEIVEGTNGLYAKMPEQYIDAEYLSWLAFCLAGVELFKLEPGEYIVREIRNYNGSPAREAFKQVHEKEKHASVEVGGVTVDQATGFPYVAYAGRDKDEHDQMFGAKDTLPPLPSFRDFVEDHYRIGAPGSQYDESIRTLFDAFQAFVDKQLVPALIKRT